MHSTGVRQLLLSCHRLLHAVLMLRSDQLCIHRRSCCFITLHNILCSMSTTAHVAVCSDYTSFCSKSVSACVQASGVGAGEEDSRERGCTCRASSCCWHQCRKTGSGEEAHKSCRVASAACRCQHGARHPLPFASVSSRLLHRWQTEHWFALPRRPFSTFTPRTHPMLSQCWHSSSGLISCKRVAPRASYTQLQARQKPALLQRRTPAD